MSQTGSLNFRAIQLSVRLKWAKQNSGKGEGTHTCFALTLRVQRYQINKSLQYCNWLMITYNIFLAMVETIAQQSIHKIPMSKSDYRFILFLLERKFIISTLICLAMHIEWQECGLKNIWNGRICTKLGFWVLIIICKSGKLILWTAFPYVCGGCPQQTTPRFPVFMRRGQV